MKLEESEWNAFFPWKALLYPGHIEAILEGNFLPPVILHVYPTNECNSNCRWCIMEGERLRGGQLDRDVFHELIQDANSLGVKCLHVSGGGEPTLYDNLDLVQKFRGTTVLSTNGVAIGHSHKYTSQDLWKWFDRIRVSLDAGTRDTYLIVRGRDDFQQVIDNVSRLSREKQEADQRSREIFPRKLTLGLGFVLDAENWFDVFEFCRLSNRRLFDIDFIHIRPAYYPEGSEEDKDVREIIGPATQLCEAALSATQVPIFAMSDKFLGYWTERRYRKCLATPLNAVVTATGEFIVCQDVFERFGNINETGRGFRYIWGSAEHKKAIDRIRIENCPRCVMNNANEVIKYVFLLNSIEKEIL